MTAINGSNKIEIAVSKSKLTKLLIVSILFLSGGLWMIVSNPDTSNALFNNPFVKALASYGATIMGLIGIYFFSRKLFDNKPGLVIDENGIYENTSIFNFGLIPWSDISHIYGSAVQASIASKQHFITIGLFNPEKYISREKNLLKRKLLSANAGSYGSPIHISANGLKTNSDELLKLLIEEYAKHKDRN
ncbi:MAG TPA: STM3941 family protein [Flavitalea sp.]|nr:STM3941 family protein [Flavitalea sp.]